jgi:hypothetical protein
MGGWLLSIIFSILIFIIYAVERGVSSFAGTNLLTSWLPQAMSTYLLTSSLGVLLGGIFLDKKRSKDVLKWIVPIGTAAILGLTLGNPWVFGIGFGLTAVIIKLAPFSSMLKLFDGGDALRLANQAAAKNFGGAAFILFLGSAVASLGFDLFIYLLAGLFFVISSLAVMKLPDDRIPGWEWDKVKALCKTWKWWWFAAYFFVQGGLYYFLLMKQMPALLASGYTKATVIPVIAGLQIAGGLLRYPLGWIMDRWGYGRMLVVHTALYFLSWLLMPFDASLWVCTFTLAAAASTPSYWAYAKSFGKEMIATVVSLGLVIQYLGAGIIVGKWL